MEIWNLKIRSRSCVTIKMRLFTLVVSPFPTLGNQPFTLGNRPFTLGGPFSQKQPASNILGFMPIERSFLGQFCAQQPVDMERAEGLEQLRALYLGARIRLVTVEVESWGVDVPEDIKKIETWLQNK